MSQALDVIQWVNDLKRATHDMIINDDILNKAPSLFGQCEGMATKSDGVLSDGGAFTLMTELFCNCLCHQFNQVERLFMEFFPRMPPNWKLHREIWMFRLMMYQRFRLSDAKIRRLCGQLEARIQSGKIKSVASRIYEHWLMSEN